MYKIQIHQQASKKLKSLNAKDRLRITSKITELSYDPNAKMLDIKKLTGEIYWPLRVGGWRIVYNIDNETKVIKIEHIKPRGDAYK